MATLSDEVDMLRRIPLFAAIDPGKLKLLAFASDRMIYRDGQPICRQGEVGDAAYVVVSGVADIVVETDGPDGEARLTEFGRKNGPLPATLTIRSGSGRGFHRYFVHPGYRVTTRANPEIQIDVKGDGGFCVLPPSRHKSGGLYEVILPVAPAPLPHGLLEFVEAEARSAKVRESPRNASARIVGQANRVASSTSHRARKQPVNRTNVALVQSILDALPDEWVVDFDDWLRVGFALHDFDPGKVGLALWRRFSMRCPQKAAQTDFDDRWESFTRGYDGPSVTLGTLIQAAKASGWRQSCRWDYATYDNRAGSKKRD